MTFKRKEKRLKAVTDKVDEENDHNHLLLDPLANNEWRSWVYTAERGALTAE
jgi:hypothetical protein